MVLLRPVEKPWGIIAISVVLSTFVPVQIPPARISTMAFVVLYPVQNAEGRATGAACFACIV